VYGYLSERGKSRMALPAAGLYARYRHLVPELLKFCVVGGLGAVVDLGGAAVLHGKFHVEGLEAKAISTIIATVLTYLGSRFWTFKHRENQALGREVAIFVVLNVIGLLIAEAVIAIVTYGLGLHSQLEYNAASVLGTGLATIFRYFAYRQWVFTAPAEESALASTAAEAEQVPDYPPWDLDPAYAAAAAATGHADTPWEPSAEPHPAEAPTEARGWGEPAGRPAPWIENMENPVISNGPLTSPVLATEAATGQDLGRSASASSDQRSPQGRHRRH
jgi:putative flippase GtrA